MATQKNAAALRDRQARGRSLEPRAFHLVQQRPAQVGRQGGGQLPSLLALFGGGLQEGSRGSTPSRHHRHQSLRPVV